VCAIILRVHAYATFQASLRFEMLFAIR